MCVRRFNNILQHLVYLCRCVRRQNLGKCSFCCQVFKSFSYGKYTHIFIISDIYHMQDTFHVLYSTKQESAFHLTSFLFNVIYSQLRFIVIFASYH